MKTLICPTCGCSLIRLGIKPQEENATTVNGNKHYFCCKGCLDMFLMNPARFIEEVDDIHVCPVCLAEKITAHTVTVVHDDLNLHFCRCPFCEVEFRKNPGYFIDRLEGKTDFKGLFSDTEKSCCGQVDCC